MKDATVLYTGKAHTTGGRDGASRTNDGRLDMELSTPPCPYSKATRGNVDVALDLCEADRVSARTTHHSHEEPTMRRFANRTVIVTGGARGMGASHARGFVVEGANVVIADVLEQEGQTLAEDLGDQAAFVRLDVTSDRDWAAAMAAAEDAFGPISVLINNAGIVRFGLIAETEPAVWRHMLDINLTGTYLGIRAVVPSMRKAGGGAIVNISSGAGMTDSFGVGAFVAGMWGVRGMTKTAALELARDNIRVNSIHAGNVITPMSCGSEAVAVGAPAARNLSTPRIAQPAEITQLVLFIASDEARFSTGSEFLPDAGHMLG